jgi:choline monooxygenase
MYSPAERLSQPGQYVAEEVAGYPVFVAVEPDGTLRGFHNVCPHRAGVIVWPGAGTTGNLVCRYHGWAFGWDGSLKSARDFGDDAGLCPVENGLTPIHVERWRNLVFVHLGDDPPPLAEAIAPFAAECVRFDLESMTYGHRLVRVLACNWKTYADNYLEGYHVPLIHPSLNRALDMSTYRVDVPDLSYCIHRSDTTEGSPAGGAWLFRYPNLAVNVYADGMNVERIVPVGRDTTHVVYDYFARDLDQIDAMVEMSNVVLDEDAAMCEAVQRNLDAGVYRAGRLSPRHEASVAWFQNRIVTAVGRP